MAESGSAVRGGRVNPLYPEFLALLEKEDKGACIDYALSALSSGKIDVVTLYTELLERSLKEMRCSSDENTCIWREHVRSSIIRAVIECSYAHVARERDSKYSGPCGKKVVVVCPTEELHELGARMVADFFTLAGYDSVFIGANTPMSVILSAMSQIHPDIVALSVTNYYNLFAAKKAIASIRAQGPAGLLIAVGGVALKDRLGGTCDLGADIQISSFEDIMRLREGA